MTTVYNVKGVVGGTVQNANAAGVVYGGMGHSYHNEGSRAVDVSGVVGVVSSGDNNSGQITTVLGAQNTSNEQRDPRTLTSAEMLDHVRKFECSDNTVDIFSENKVTGILFMDHFDDELLKDLNVTNNIEKRKLKSLHKYLREKR